MARACPDHLTFPAPRLPLHLPGPRAAPRDSGQTCKRALARSLRRPAPPRPAPPSSGPPCSACCSLRQGAGARRPPTVPAGTGWKHASAALRQLAPIGRRHREGKGTGDPPFLPKGLLCPCPQPAGFRLRPFASPVPRRRPHFSRGPPAHASLSPAHRGCPAQAQPLLLHLSSGSTPHSQSRLRVGLLLLTARLLSCNRSGEKTWQAQGISGTVIAENRAADGDEDSGCMAMEPTLLLS